jgi:ubiquinone/menaquinone biosynthesis C-methylase UbiE
MPHSILQRQLLHRILLAAMSWFFKDACHSKIYLQHRPTYPSEVFKIILSWLSNDNANIQRRTAIDVGCGTGQSTLPLCDYFDEVFGIDPSETQIGEAQQSAIQNDKQNVKFVSGLAHNLSAFMDESVDLITAAQAAHWFDLNKFFSESLRVLKPGGALAVYGYGVPVVAKTEGHSITMQVIFVRFHTYEIYMFVNVQQMQCQACLFC